MTKYQREWVIEEVQYQTRKAYYKDHWPGLHRVVRRTPEGLRGVAILPGDPTQKAARDLVDWGHMEPDTAPGRLHLWLRAPARVSRAVRDGLKGELV